MMRSLPYKTKQFFVLLIKIGIVVGAIYFVFHRITSNDGLDVYVFLEYLRKNDVFTLQNVCFLILLSFFNCHFEILKWKYLVSSVTHISLKNAAEQSLAALTASLFTPNRIGDYGAKAIYFQKSLRKKVMFLNLMGNMMQMTTTLVFGFIGFLFFALHFSLELEAVKISISMVAFVLILIVVFFVLKKSQFKIKGISLNNIRTFVRAISLQIKVKVFLYSTIRYLIFSYQFYFLLMIFDVNIDYVTAMMAITTMYFLSSILPTIVILDVLIKGSVAVYLFSMFGVNDLTILCIVTLMWLLNFVIPSVIGSYYVLNFRLPKVNAPI